MPSEALADFRRFPTWMWRNTDVVEFVEWLRAHNDALPQGAAKVGFYGLDLYSLRASMEAVLGYLEKVDPEAAKRARERYACFDHFGEDTQVYGFVDRHWHRQVVRGRGRQPAGRAAAPGRRVRPTRRRDGRGRVLLRRAERPPGEERRGYYRSMFLEEVSSWNLRDRHMAETLDALVAHLERQRRARQGRRLGAQLAPRRRARDGDGPARRAERRPARARAIRPRCRAGRLHHAPRHGHGRLRLGWAGRAQARPAGAAGSYEALFHAARPARFLLTWRDGDTATEGLREPRLERAIGVIYRPETERMSHYFQARLPDQFDAVLHFDETRAVEPLEPPPSGKRASCRRRSRSRSKRSMRIQPCAP